MYQFKFIDDKKSQIQIDDFRESFISDYAFWSKDQYEEQWEDGADVVRSGKPAIFITSITDPETSNFIRTWVCYPIDGQLVFQEVIVFLDEIGGPFDLSNPHKHVPKRETVTEDGDSISEWITNV
jgi:hypothetical protein